MPISVEIPMEAIAGWVANKRDAIPIINTTAENTIAVLW